LRSLYFQAVLMKLAKNRTFWVIVITFALVCLFHYAEVIGMPGTAYPSFHFGLTRHTFDRILFFVPIIYAAFIFGRRGALITSFAVLAVMLPRAILISPVVADALLETGGVFAVGMIASWGVWTRAEEKEKTRAALLKLQSAHDILQHYMQAVRKSEKRQNILNTIANLLGESLETKSILRKAVHMISELIEGEIGLIFSLDEKSQKLQLVASEGVSDEFIRAVDGQRVGEGLYGEVARTYQPMVVDSASGVPWLSMPETSNMQIEAQLIVPMIIKDRIRGVLCVATRRPRQFSIDNIELLTAVGTQIATAVENAFLLEKERRAAQQLAVSERSLRQLFENASDAILVHDLEGNITVANEAAAKLTGYSREELVKMNLAAFLSDEMINMAGEVRHKLMEKVPVEQPYEQHLLRKDGSEMVLKLTTSLVTENGRPRGFQHIARDVTRQKEEEEMLAKTIEGSPVPTFAISKQHKITHWNKAIEALSGVKKEEVIGTNKQWVVFYTEKRLVMADLIVDGTSAGEIETYYGDKGRKSPLIEGVFEAEDFFPALGGDGRWLHFTASPIKDNRGEVVGAIETLRDVTEERRMQESLRYYLSQITTIQEEERKRIGRELHDDTSQVLYALSRQVDNFSRNNTELTPSSSAFLVELRQQLNNISAGMRRFIHELRPPMLDDLGLLATLRWQFDNLEKRSGMESNLVVSGVERRFVTEVELTIFRIVQEALRNVEKHARASKVEVGIEFGEGKTKVSVCDNGVGFDSGENLTDLPRAGKLGLVGMEERVHLLGGRMEIDSEPGKGTRVMIEIPM